MTRSLTLPSVLALAGTVLLVPAARSADWDAHMSLSGERVHIFNLAGKAEIVAGTGKSVTIEPTAGGQDGARIDVKTINNGNEPSLVFVYPDRKIIYRKSGSNWNSSYRVTMDVSGDGRFGDGWDKRASSGINRRKV